MENATPRQQPADEFATAPAAPINLLARLRSLEAEFRQRGIVKVDMFVPSASGDSIADCDVDLLIALAPGQRFTLFDWAGVELRLTDALGIEAHLGVWRSVPASRKDELEREAVSVF